MHNVVFRIRELGCPSQKLCDVRLRFRCGRVQFHRHRHAAESGKKGTLTSFVKPFCPAANSKKAPLRRNRSSEGRCLFYRAKDFLFYARPVFQSAFGISLLSTSSCVPSCRMMRGRSKTTVAFAGTSSVTTQFAPILTLSPM